MIGKSVIAKLWLAIVLLMIVVLIILGTGLFQLVENFYYAQIAQNHIDQGKQVISFYLADPEEFIRSDKLNTISQTINSHLMLLNKQSIIQMCNNMLHFTPDTFFAEEELNRIFTGEIIAKRGYHGEFAEQMLSVGLPVTINGQVEFALFMYTPVAPITATLLSFRSFFLLGLVGTIFLASILAFFLSRTLSRPLIDMNTIALDMARGNFSQRVTVKSGDEIGVLGASLNYLSGELSKAEEVRREFVANVSHELRTPVSLIQGYTEAILDELPETTEQKQNFLMIIKDEASRLHRLVDDLLELSRLQSGVTVLEKEWVEIKTIAQRLKEKYSNLFQESQTTFKVEIEPGAEKIWVDPFRFEQVLINLISNAIRYTPGGVVHLVVSREENQAVIKIVDNGRGIPDDDLPYIFERFYRADKSRNRDSGGSGLGLAIVKNIIEAHGGSVAIQSSPEYGTTISLHLELPEQ